MAGRAVRSGKTRSAETGGKRSACGNFSRGTAAAARRFAGGCSGRSCKIAQHAHASRKQNDPSDLRVKLYFDL